MSFAHGGVSALMVAFLCAQAPAALADGREKVDVITTFNGDRLTGEIKSLAYGRLMLATDYMGTVQIEWTDIVRVESPQAFLIEDVDGHMLFGSIGPHADKGYLAIAGPDQVMRRVGLLQVARLSQSEDRLMDRVHGSLSLGFDYTKSSDIAVLSGTFTMSYRGPSSTWNLGVEMNSTDDPTQGTLDRDSVEYGYRWLRQGGQFWTGITSLERNEETGIEARLLLGGGYGRYFLQTSSTEIAGLVGLGAIREWVTGEEDNQTSVEGILGFDWRIFDFASPKTNLTAKVVAYPSLTVSGRYRTDTSISLRREIITDFFVDLSLFQTYDSDPVDLAAEKSDYGVITSLGYSF